ncbi:Sterol-sensing domain protein [Metarhizium album ARSEF 1941]|uniref:Sterol-sensing domain protein n=1 Tax=Metarhizium album (strain ARSEF 1941) TaxID=1081103 RepID=A0A0B2WN94_METAS|nr:Sterol-sensing domain protein [Metarhizium album ARSEF 1941]KHN95413.1 Sterol-sensing domain protein [Metarhizium album ARSEF 1941]
MGHGCRLSTHPRFDQFVNNAARTTKPPDLAPSHSLRSGFTRYGRYVAGHVVTALLISATVATILVYPIPYLFTSDFVNGASYLPHHAWTVAQPLTYDAAVEPDISMRSIWVHSSYMEALNADLLASALELQDELLGETKFFSPRDVSNNLAKRENDDQLSLAQRNALHISNGLTNQSWFFHSPLLYWHSSLDSLLADLDILSTINDKKNQSNFANTTLRHSVVFSGKRFEDRRLVAADAIVITLLCLGDSPVGREWERRALSLPEKVSDIFDVYPSDGRYARSQLYEFQFRPISPQDILSLALAYGFAVFYLLMSLSKLRAVKSKIGLIVTIITQITFSIMSSFAICAIFNFDLSRIPQAAYPLVVLSMSLENIFRLINAVILTPSQDSTSNRIGHAFGQTAHTALVCSLQNVLILVGLSRVVSPGVSAFCIFAAVAIVFDFFYLSTFFLSVLSVDVRRMELGDALAKAALRQSQRKYHGNSRGPLSDGFFQGNIAWSTRLAGTVVMLGFVIIAQWHFFGDDNMFRKLLRLYRGTDNDLPTPDSSLLQGLHQARSHTSWLRNQDHETAEEIIRLIKPGAYSYVARVFEPLVFVKRDSDRMPHSKEPTLLPAVYDFVHHQLSRFVVIVVVIIAALRLLINYLLWGEDAELGNDGKQDDTPLVSVHSMRGGHILDVALLSKSKAGHIVSVGLDRVVQVWNIRGRGYNYVVADGSDSELCPFPILGMSIDGASTWLALLSTSRVSFWNLVEQRWGGSMPLESSSQKPAALFFDPTSDSDKPTIVLIHHNGTMVQVTAGTQNVQSVSSICPEPLALACALIKKSRPEATISIAMVSKRGHVYIGIRQESPWNTRLLDLKSSDVGAISQIVPLSPLGVFALAASNCVYLISSEEGEVLRTLHTERMIPRSLQCTYSGPVSKPGLMGLASLNLCYVGTETGDCVLQAYVPTDDCEFIHLQSPDSKINDDGCACESAKEVKKRVKNPGTWHVLSDGSVVGIRRVNQTYKGTSNMGSTLRRRRTTGQNNQYCFASWEVWVTSPCNKPDLEECRPLLELGDESNHLVVSEIGPKVAVGLRSVAFAFGNVIKLVTSGPLERFDVDPENDSYGALMNTSSRRRKLGQAARTKAPC